MPARGCLDSSEVAASALRAIPSNQLGPLRVVLDGGLEGGEHHFQGPGGPEGVTETLRD